MALTFFTSNKIPYIIALTFFTKDMVSRDPKSGHKFKFAGGRF